MLKGLILSLFIQCFCWIVSFSQGFEITAFYGYQSGAGVDVLQGRLRVLGAQNFGGAVDISLPFSSGNQVEFLYIRQGTSMELDRVIGGTDLLFDASVEYFQAGVLRKVVKAGPVAPFLALTGGWATLNPDAVDRSSETRLAFTAGAGAKIYLGKFGLRFQARLMSPIQWGSAGLFCGSGGCSVGVSSTSSIVQADFTGGVFLALGDNE